MSRFDYSYLINHLKINTARRNFFFEIYVTKQTKDMLAILLELNVIRRYLPITKYKYRIFPSWSAHAPTYRKIKVYGRSVSPIRLSYKALATIQQIILNSVLVLQTPHGLLTHKSALKRKTGGKVICFLL